MNIDYAKIIELADKRRETLMELSERLSEAAAVHKTLSEALRWIMKVYDLYQGLDEEGRKLLPPEVQTALQFVGSTHRHLADAIDVKTYNPGHANAHGVKYLIAPESKHD